VKKNLYHYHLGNLLRGLLIYFVPLSDLKEIVLYEVVLKVNL